ncbi:MAG TPA: hypothetical protein VGX48_18610 [Pyrinomonadaceae bacterium]|jgi:hypothetical protein|nr:hypothetical protein [Pyrinomonadaceae bacterium]
MSSETRDAGAAAKQAPTEQQESSAGKPRRLVAAQTVCNEKNEKGKLCNGHIKELNTQHPSDVYLRGDDVLYRCQACGALYMGPPMGHVRDPRKQRRYVERDLAAILQAAGGTLPAYQYPTPSWRDEPPPRPAKAKTLASSPAADRHRPAAEAQAATGQASAAPMSPTAATASPAAGAETPADLAPAASTELTPAAPKDERPAASAETKPAAEAKPAAPKGKKGAHSGFKVGPEFREQPGETNEQKIARLKRLVEEAKRAAGKL